MSIITVSSMLLAVGAVAYADTTLKKISAYQNAAISIEVDNQKVNLSSSEGTMYPIIYEGHSYVSAKAVSEALGATVKWDNSRQAVVITSANGGTSTSVVPDKDNTVAQATAKPATVSTPPATEPTPQATPKPAASSSATTSSNSGASFADAVKLGTSFTYTDLDNNYSPKGDSTSAQYTFTINKVTSTTLGQLHALGFEEHVTDPDVAVDYVLLDVTLKVKNATLVKGSEDQGRKFLSSFTPTIWGVETSSGQYYIGGSSDYFEGSLGENIEKLLADFPEVTPSKPGSFEASGKVVLPIIKGKENTLILYRNDSKLESDKRSIYFKLK
ncbi:stalk domain-containing protein [Paenibacillus sp. FSL H7-0918]